MIFDKKIIFYYENLECEFRTMKINDVKKSYIDGLKDEKKYLLNIPKELTIKSQKKYINDIINSENNTICGLFINGELIGTAGIQSKFSQLEIPNLSSIGIFIFNKNFRGIGLGKTLVWASVYLTNKTLKTKYFIAGMNKDNLPSLNSFLSCGFKILSSNRNYKLELSIKNLKKSNKISNVRTL